MGNNMGGGGSIKVMKIDGELFKLKIPVKVLDVIKDYPDHVLLDSDDFLRFNLRAKPLHLQHQLLPKRLYLLVQLPNFPKSLRRVQSDRAMEVVRRRITRRSVSDLPIMTASTAITEFDGGGSVGRARLKIRLRKSVMDRIVEESEEEAEVGERILRLCLEECGGDLAEDGGGCGDEERENTKEAAADGSCFNVCGMCSPVFYQRKYKRLSST